MGIATVDGHPRTDTKPTSSIGGVPSTSATPESEFSAFLHGNTQTVGKDSLRTKLVRSADSAATDHSVTKSIVSRETREEGNNQPSLTREHGRQDRSPREETYVDAEPSHARDDSRPVQAPSSRPSEDQNVSGEAEIVDAVVRVAESPDASGAAASSQAVNPKNVKKSLHVDGKPSEKEVTKGLRTHSSESKAAHHLQTEATTKKTTKQPKERSQAAFRTVNPEQSEGLEKAAGTAAEGGLKVTVKTDHRAEAPQTRTSEFSGNVRGEGSQSGLPTSGQNAQGKASKDDGAPSQGQTRGDNGSSGSSAPQGSSSSVLAGSSAVAGSASTFRAAVESTTGQTTESSPSVKGPTATGSLDPQQATKESVKTQKPARPVHSSHTKEQTPAEQIRVKITKGIKSGDTIRIQLRPESLGKVDVRLDVHDGRVSASIVVDTRETLDMLKNDVRNLEKALNEAGLKTDQSSLNFSLRGEGQSNQAQQKAQDERSGPGTPYDTHAQNLDDDLVEDVPLDTLRAAAAQARGGVDVKI